MTGNQIRFRETRGRVAEFDDGNSVRFRTRSHGRRAGDGGHSGHGGREVIRHNNGEDDTHVYVHRLTLYAWSPELDIEDLWAAPEDERTSDPRTDKMEAHHICPVPWLNAEWNLEWQAPDDHSRIESTRRERGADGAYAGLRAPPGP